MMYFIATMGASRPGGILMVRMRSVRSGLLLAGLVAGALLPAAAQAHWRGRVFFGVGPGWGPPAYYYPPPVYMVPPPVYAPPPAEYAAPPAEAEGPPPMAQACYAGPWVCPLQRAIPAGNSCACEGTNGPVWGRAR